MLNRKESTTKVISLNYYYSKVSELSRILEKYSDEERMNKISNFTKKLTIEEDAKVIENLRKACREYCSMQMNDTAFAQEIFSEKKAIQDKLEKIRREYNHLVEKMVASDKVLVRTEKVDNKKRKELSKLIVVEENKIEELHGIFNEFKSIIERVCTTETDIDDARFEIRILMSHLEYLSGYLHK